MDLKECFRKHAEEQGYFVLIENPLHRRPDVCGFLYLDTLCCQSSRDMINHAEYGQIYLSTDCRELAELAEEKDILYLVRCGISYDADKECLTMFV